MKNGSLLAVRIRGDLACFTRPEMKVERVSYPVPTPSAARGILEAIFWKPEFRWDVKEIQVLSPIRYFSIVRNEMGRQGKESRASYRSARAWQQQGGGFDASDKRTQRHTLALRDVDYVIRADIDVRLDVGDDPAKYRDQFRRRVAKGQCFAQPYLGCREFAAAFTTADGAPDPIPVTDDLGPMLLDLEYRADGTGTPRFFNAQLDRGILRVPESEVA